MRCAAQRSFGAQADGESDELKRVLLEGNPYFLAVTVFVSILHSVFDMLAFKNDIGFWRNKKSVEGLSVRTVGINCACQVWLALLQRPRPGATSHLSFRWLKSNFHCGDLPLLPGHAARYMWCSAALRWPPSCWWQQHASG